MAEAAAKIAELTGVERKPTQIREFLKRIGMSPRRVASVPAKGDSEKQKDYLHHVLEPRLEEAKAGKRTVFFMDASHFVLAPFLGIVWCFSRLFIKAPSGRQRFNVLGALNAITQEMITVTNDTYITAHQVCQLLDNLAAAHPDTSVSVVLDNARYQHCALVEEHARQLNIELLFLPSYSPNLNLIERFWRHVKKECLYSHYYPTFTEFKQAISTCIEQAPLKHQAKLQSLLSLRFHIFEQTATLAA